MSARIILIAALAAILGVIGFYLLKTPKPAPPAVMALAPVPPPPPPVAHAGELASTPVAAKPAPAPPPVILPPLKQVSVEAVPIHVPPPEAPAPAGRPLDLRNVDAAPLPSRTAALPGASAERVAPRQFSGPARVTSAIGLIVGRIPVELYGIRQAEERDCGGVSCDQAAEAALREHLATGQVSCHTPHASLGVVAFAICLDGNGVDLAGMLVGDGLALANKRESRDYAGAENIAHDLRHGLWQSR